jgi:saccharopine dehydrogenase-like NADP-dependent oxidoreductase
VDSVLIIGAGAAGSVVAKKCAMNRDVFKRIHLASRRLESCKKVQAEVQAATKIAIDISELDADNVAETVKRIRASILSVINMALPYQDCHHGRWRPACTIWTPPTTNLGTRQIRIQLAMGLSGQVPGQV